MCLVGGLQAPLIRTQEAQETLWTSEFLFFEKEGTFEDATLTCSQHNATVARIANKEENNFVILMIRNVSDAGFYIGKTY